MATKLAMKVARIHQSQNLGPVPKTRLQQHEPSANNGGSQTFPGLGKRLGGPLKPRR